MIDKFEREQTEIFRKMNPLQKLRMVDDFFRFGRKLQKRANPEVIIALDDYRLGQKDERKSR